MIVVAAWVPATGAYDTSLARTTQGGCVLVAWTESPYVVTSPATGCTINDPCVDVNWGVSPPAVTTANCS
jgi:hypothetical protein